MAIRSSAISAISPLRTIDPSCPAVSAASGGTSIVSTPRSPSLRCCGPGDALPISRICCVRSLGFGDQHIASARSKALRISLQPTAEATSTMGGSRSSPTTRGLKTRADTRTGVLSAGCSVFAQRASRRTSSTSTYPRRSPTDTKCLDTNPHEECARTAKANLSRLSPRPRRLLRPEWSILAQWRCNRRP